MCVFVRVVLLDRLTVGPFSRSQVLRMVLADFLRKSEREQKNF